MEEYQKSISQLESDISKTIENNTDKLKKAEEEIQKVLEENKKHHHHVTKYNSDNDDGDDKIDKNIIGDDINKLTSSSSSLSSLKTDIIRDEIIELSKKLNEDEYVIEDTLSYNKKITKLEEVVTATTINPTTMTATTTQTTKDDEITDAITYQSIEMTSTMISTTDSDTTTIPTTLSPITTTSYLTTKIATTLSPSTVSIDSSSTLPLTPQSPSQFPSSTLTSSSSSSPSLFTTEITIQSTTELINNSNNENLINNNSNSNSKLKTNKIKNVIDGVEITTILPIQILKVRFFSSCCC